MRWVICRLRKHTAPRWQSMRCVPRLASSVDCYSKDNLTVHAGSTDPHHGQKISSDAIPCLHSAQVGLTGSVDPTSSIKTPQVMQNKSSASDSAPQARQTPRDKAPVNTKPRVRLPRGPLGLTNSSGRTLLRPSADFEPDASEADSTGSAVAAGSTGSIGARAGTGSGKGCFSSFSAEVFSVSSGVFFESTGSTGAGAKRGSLEGGSSSNSSADG